MTASACVVLALIIVWIVERTRLPGRGLLTFTSTVTFAFPGVALAVGFVLGYGGPTLALFGTIWLFFIAFTAHRFPFAFMFMRNSVKQLSSEMEEAARVAGASWVRSIVDISAPLLKSGIVAAWMIVFAVTLRELSMAILLYVPGMETLPVAIYSFIDNGTFEIAAAVSVVLIAAEHRIDAGAALDHRQGADGIVTPEDAVQAGMEEFSTDERRRVIHRLNDSPYVCTGSASWFSGLKAGN